MRPQPDSGPYPSLCCGARSMVLELVSAGSSSGDAWLTGAPAYTESFMRALCTGCGREWRRPRRLVVLANGIAVEA
jgi:hypothetical protein